MDALEIVVRDVQAAFNSLNVGSPAITFGFSGLKREQSQPTPGVWWQELGGSLTQEPSGSALAADNAIGFMRANCEVGVQHVDRETARRMLYLVVAASRLVPSSHGSVTWDSYENPGDTNAEHGKRGWLFVASCTVDLPIPAEGIPVTTDVIVLGHEHEVEVDGVVVAGGSSLD